MSYDKSVLKKEQKGLLKCALDQRGPSNVPKEKKMVPKNFKVRPKKPSNKFLKCAQGKKNVPKSFKVCPKNLQISPSNVPKQKMDPKKSKTVLLMLHP
jgi:hypothetical protein